MSENKELEQEFDHKEVLSELDNKLPLLDSEVRMADLLRTLYTQFKDREIISLTAVCEASDGRMRIFDMPSNNGFAIAGCLLHMAGLKANLVSHPQLQHILGADEDEDD